MRGFSIRFTVLFLVAVLAISSGPTLTTGMSSSNEVKIGQMATLQSTNPMEMSLQEIASNLDVYDGPEFDKTLAAEAIAYRRAWDGGYTEDLADIRSTFEIYRLLSLFGLTVDEEANFVKFVEERFYLDSYYGFTRVPGLDYGIGQEDAFIMAIMYDELTTNTLPSLYMNRLVDEAKNIFANDYYYYLTEYYAALFLSHFGLTGVIDLAAVLSEFTLRQNTDTDSIYYGAISRYQDSTYYYDYTIENLPYIFETVKLIGGTLEATFDLASLDSYLDSLRERVTSKYSPISWNYANLNYNETYSNLAEYTRGIYEFQYNDYMWRTTLGVYGVRAQIDMEYTSNFSLSSATDMLLDHTLNSYWIDENSDDIIDRDPWNRYLPYYWDSNTPFHFAYSVENLGVSGLVDTDALRRQIRSRMMVEGGVSYADSNIRATHAALSSLYHMDTDGLSYVTAIPLDNSLTFLKNLNYTHTSAYSFNNGTQYSATWFIETTNRMYNEFETTWTNWGYDQTQTVKVLDIFNKLNRLNELDSFRTNLEALFTDISEEGQVQTDMIRPEEAFNLLEATDILGIASKLNFTGVLNSLPLLQTQAGGFFYSLSWDNSLNFASGLTNLPGAMNHTQYQELIKNDLQTTSFEQGLDWEYARQDYIHEYATSQLVNYLSAAGVLDDWIAQDILNVTLVSKGAHYAYDHYTYDGIRSYLYDIKREYEALDNLGIDFNNFPSNIQYNNTEVVRYVSDLQITTATATTEHPAGSFAYRIDTNGDYQYTSGLASVYNALFILDVTGQLSQIDTSLTLDYLNSMIVTDSSRSDYGMFKYSPDYDWGDQTSTYYGVLALEILGQTHDYDLEDQIVYENWNERTQEYYYQDYQVADSLNLFGYVGISAASYNMTLVNEMMRHQTTNDGFVYRSDESVTNTYYSARSLKSLDAYDLINAENMWDNLAALQYPNVTDSYGWSDYRSGGFAYNFENSWVDLSSTEMVLHVLFRDEKLHLIDTPMAVEYVTRYFEYVGNQNNYLSLSMQGDILPAVRIFDALDDVLIPRVVAPKYVYETQTISLDIKVQDIWQNGITGVTGMVYVDDVFEGNVAELGDGYYQFAYDTTGLAPGDYNFVLNFTKTDMVFNVVDMFIEVRELEIVPDVFYANPLMLGQDLDVTIDALNSIENRISGATVIVDFGSATHNGVLNAATSKYELTLPFDTLDVGVYSFVVTITASGYSDYTEAFEVSIEDIELQWTTSSETTKIGMDEDWTASGKIIDQDNNDVVDATFDASVSGSSGTASGSFSASFLGSGEWELTFTDDNPEEDTFTVTVEIAMASLPASPITVTFTFLREENVQTAGGDPELDLLPGFEFYIAMFALVAIPIIRRRKE